MDADDYVQLYVTANVNSGTPSLKSDSDTTTRFGGFRVGY